MRMGSLSLVSPYSSAKRCSSLPRLPTGAELAVVLGRAKGPTLRRVPSEPTPEPGGGASARKPTDSATGPMLEMDLTLGAPATSASASSPLLPPSAVSRRGRPRRVTSLRKVHGESLSSHMVQTLLSALVIQRDLRRRHASHGRDVRLSRRFLPLPLPSISSVMFCIGLPSKQRFLGYVRADEREAPHETTRGRFI